MHFQEQLVSMHQFTNLLANAVLFQPQAVLPAPRLASAARGLQGSERDGSPPHKTVGSPLNRLSSPACYQQEVSDEGDLSTGGGTTGSTVRRKGEGVGVTKVPKVAGVLETLTSLLPPMERGRRKMGFPAKSQFPLLVVRKVTLMM